MRRDEGVPLELCDGCRRKSASTVNGICLSCAQGVLRQRRVLFPRSEGNRYMRRVHGLADYFNLEIKR